MHKAAANKPNSFSPTPGLWGGVGLWAVYSLVVLMLRGVRWDEDFEFAQAMIGSVAYPEAHPLLQYTRNVYNLQFWAAALQLWLIPSAVLLNGVRNYLFIASTMIPSFMLGTVATGRALWGHAAALLMLYGIHLEFDGSYPQFIWPGMFSNGHVGIGYTLILVALLVGGRWRLGLLLFGLMPAIHLGQMAPLLVFVPLYAAWAIRWGHGPALRKAVPYLVAGLVFSIVFFLVQRQFGVAPPADGPYYSTADPRPIWEGRLAAFDLHRQIPHGNIHLIAWGVVLLGIAGMRIEAVRKTPALPFTWLYLYSLCTVMSVYGLMAIHIALGSDIPYVFMIWQPYRLLNHLAPILMVLCLAALSGAIRLLPNNRTAARCAIFAILAFLLAQPVIAQLLPESVASRYLTARDSAFFLLYGGALGAMVLPLLPYRLFLMPWLVAVGVSLAALAVLHQFGFACAALGLAGTVFLERYLGMPWNTPRAEPRLLRATGFVLAAMLGAVTVQQMSNRVHLPRSQFTQDVETYLAERDPMAMIVGPPYQLLLQAHTNHPVMVDMATPYHSSYVPKLGPSVQNIYRDIYGIEFTNPNHADDKVWRSAWRERSRQDWRAIGKTFDFAYVVAPGDLALALEPVVNGESDTLYWIDDDGS